jgi:hypothetical protein
MKENTIDLNAFRTKSCVNGSMIKSYVYDQINFTLPEHIYEAVEEIVADFWNRLPCGACFCQSDFEHILTRLKSYDILIGESYIRHLSTKLVEALEYYGHLHKR